MLNVQAFREGGCRNDLELHNRKEVRWALDKCYRGVGSSRDVWPEKQEYRGVARETEIKMQAQRYQRGSTGVQIQGLRNRNTDAGLEKQEYRYKATET